MSTQTILPGRQSDAGPVPSDPSATAAGRTERFLDAAVAAGEICHKMQSPQMSARARRAMIGRARHLLSMAEEQL